MRKEKAISPMINRLKEQIKNNNDNTLQNFWNKIEKQSTPLIEDIQGDSENVLVTFLYRCNGEVDCVMVYGGVPGFRYGENKLERIENSDVWFKTYKVRKNIKFKYKVCINYIDGESYASIKEKSVIDKLNKRIVKRPKDEEIKDSKENIESYVEIGKLPEEIWTKKRAETKEGNITLHKMRYDNEEKRIWVYTPYGYEEDLRENNLLVLTDGLEHINYLNAKNVLDNLIHEKKIENTVCLFIESGQKRYEELTCNKEYAEFIIKEIIPWARRNHRITSKAEKSIIGGLSLGGLFASYVGLNYSNVFGNVLSQSGSYWWEKGWLTERYKEHEKLPLKVYLNVGVLEDKPYDDEPIMRDYIDGVRDVLTDKGYEVHYEQFPSGHDFLSWGEFLGRGLVKVFSE